MKTICFWLQHVGERGMCIATYDYAYYNESLLHNKSVVLYNRDDTTNDMVVIEKFASQFEVYACSISEIDEYVSRCNGDAIYILKHGRRDALCNIKTPTLVHSVFDCSEPHGSIYACVSPDVYNSHNAVVVPHMINLPEVDSCLREKYNIPPTAVVFGRHGGYDQFNVEYVQKAVFEIASAYPDIYFLFLHTRPFCDPLPNIIHIEKTIDLYEKTEFINTCDAMIWGRSGGETFGLSIGEFSSRNKPVFCADMGARSHITILGDKAILYDKTNLHDKMIEFSNKVNERKHNNMVDTTDWNAFRAYTPEKVMSRFNQVFLQD